MTVRWVVLAAIVVAACGTPALPSPDAGNVGPVAKDTPAARTRSAADIEAAYGVSVVSVEDGGTRVRVAVDDESCRRTAVTGIEETADEVTLHMRVPRLPRGATCNPVGGGTVHDIELCAPVWGRRVVLSVGRPPAETRC